MNDETPQDLFEGSAPAAGVGHNNPPETPYRADVVEAHKELSDRHLEAAKAWKKMGDIQDEETAEKLNDFRAGIKLVIKDVDDDRKKDKKPYDDAGKAVQTAYVPIIDALKEAIKLTDVTMARWLADAKRRKDAEARAQREAEEARLRQIEEEKKAAEEEGDAKALVDLQKQEKAAAKAITKTDRASNQKAQVKSATGAGRTTSVREIKHAKVVKIGPCFSYFRDDPAVLELLTNLATQAIRRGEDVPGVEVKTEQKVY